MRIGNVVQLLKETYANWSAHKAPRLGASVAFYTLLSFAPLLVLTVAVIALVFDRQKAQSELIDQARQMIGTHGAETVRSLLANAQKPSSGAVASLIAFITLLFGASGVFSELRDALNIIWDAEPKSEGGLLGMVKQRLFSFGMVLSVGFLLLVSLIISAALAVIGKFFAILVPVPAFVFEVINFIVSFGVITLLFALMFKYVPSRAISWRDVRVGALGTALLFTVGKMLLGFYLGKASVGSSYGAAGSLVAVIVWVYYSAQIFFFGAEFTRVYADSHATASAESREAKPEFASAAESFQQEPAPHAGTAGHSYDLTQSIAKPAKTDGGRIAAAARTLPQRTVQPVAGLPAQRKPRPSLLLAAAAGFLFARVLSAKWTVSRRTSADTVR